jgi:hypothetical protein
MLDYKFHHQHHNNHEEYFEVVLYLLIEIVQLVLNHEEFQYKNVDHNHHNISNHQHQMLNHQEMYIDPIKQNIRNDPIKIKFFQTSFAMPFSQIASYLAPLL